MSESERLCVAILTFFLLCPSAAAQKITKPAMQKIDGTITWVYDYEKGQRISKETGKPMFVVFRCER
jgi:hypothetical protein